MATKNRPELQSEVNNAIVPTVTIAKHKDLLNNNILESVALLKDRVILYHSASGSKNFDCSVYDQLRINSTNGDININVTNISDGDVTKKVVIYKRAGDMVTFSGVNGTTDGQQYGRAEVMYHIISGGGKVYAKQIDDQFAGTITLSDIVNFTNITVGIIVFKYRQERKISFIDGYVKITTTAPLSEIGFKVSGSQFGNMPVGSYPSVAVNTSTSAIPCYCSVVYSGGIYTFTIRSHATYSFAAGDYNIYINGSLFIE